jgi:hypothetical protein
MPKKTAYDKGFDLGRAYAAEQWQRSPVWVATLIYREPRQKLWDEILNWAGWQGYTSRPVDWVRGFAAGMRKALDDHDANEWLTALPGYH